MKRDFLSKIALIVLATATMALALRPLFVPTPVRAETPSAGAYQLFVEPGTTNIKAPDGSAQSQGKVMIDMQNGNI